jgi:hypothetical protein
MNTTGRSAFDVTPWTTHPSDGETVMDGDLVSLMIVLAVLVILDVAALRCGRDSRQGSDPRHDWS